MTRQNPVQTLTQEFINGAISRRKFMKGAAALGLTAAGATSLEGQVGTAAATNAAFAPHLVAQRAAAQVAEVPREETLVAVRSGHRGQVRWVQPLESLPPGAGPTTSSART